MEFGEFSMSQRETDIGFEFSQKGVLKGLGLK